MVLSPTIPSHPETDPALDQRQLFERGLTASAACRVKGGPTTTPTTPASPSSNCWPTR